MITNGKKSFLLYCDIIYTVEKLPNEMKGLLFQKILDFVNNNDNDCDDFTVDLVFESIKQSLLRDNEKYNSIVNRNKINGLKGGRPKNPKNPVGILETQKTQRNPEKPKKADIDSDSDSDIDNDKDIINNKSNDLLSLEKWMKENTPLVLKLKTQLTSKNLEMLLIKYSKIELCEVLESMNNYQPLLKKYISVYSTLQKWLIKEYGKR